MFDKVKANAPHGFPLIMSAVLPDTTHSPLVEPQPHPV
jgi:hypothetical protein